MFTLTGCIETDDSETASVRSTPSQDKKVVDPINEESQGNYDFFGLDLSESGSYSVSGAPTGYQASLEVTGTEVTMRTSYNGCEIIRIFNDFSTGNSTSNGNPLEFANNNTVTCTPADCDQKFQMNNEFGGGLVEVYHYCRVADDRVQMVFEHEREGAEADYIWVTIGGYDLRQLGRSEITFRKSK